MFNTFVKFSYSIENNHVYSSIKKGLAALMPVLITGSAAVMLSSLPLPGYRDFLSGLFGGIILNFLALLQNAAFGFMSAYLVLGISYFYSQELRRGDITACSLSMITAFSCFAASFGAVSGTMEMSDLGPLGVFTAMVCAIVSTRLFHLFYGYFVPRFRGYWDGTNENIKASISGIIPYVLCVSVFAAVNLLIHHIFGADNFNELVASVTLGVFSGIKSDLAGGLLYLIMLDLLWFFGIHGGNMMEQVHEHTFVPANADAAVIVSKNFLDTFVLIGGCGATICLLAAILVNSKTRGSKQLAKTALPFAIFNINEFLMFGLPVILNPVMLIPFILTPIVSLLISYFMTYIGFIPVLTYEGLHWTTPAIFSGYITTSSVRGSVVQILVILVGAMIYAPFVRLSEKLREEHEFLMLDNCVAAVKAAELSGEDLHLLSRSDDIGVISKSLALALRTDIAGDNLPVFYQPQLDKDAKMTGSEALLRWRYKGRMVYPPLAVMLAKEAGVYNELTKSVITTSIDAAKRLSFELNGSYKTSANIKPAQLADAAFIDWVVAQVNAENIGGQFCLEITEDSTLEDDGRVEENTKKLNAAGVSVSIDDFSMGSTSIKYLKTGAFKYVKLDGSLVKEVVDNPRSREIIKSIVHLGEELEFEVVAEYVETEEMRGLLLELGVKYLQGYLYSKAVPINELIEFAKKY